VTLALLRHKAKPTLQQIKNAAVAGVLLLVLGQGSIVWGIQSLPSGQTALLASSAGVAYLGLIGLALGYGLFQWLDRVTSPVVAVTFQYVSPVIALVAGAVVLGERLTFLDIGASVILLSSVALMVARRPNASSSSAERYTS
jgi:drug/metabolite transporter (DMT)-like permease